MTKKITVKIDGKKYVMKTHSYRALFLWEEITGKEIANLKGLKDMVTLFYCLLKVSNEDFSYDLESFIDVIEDDEQLMTELLASQNMNIDKKKVT
jgi:hypothetical protein